MKVCDKCNKSGNLYLINIKNKKYELCDDCINHILEWLKRQSKKVNAMDKFMEGFK